MLDSWSSEVGDVGKAQVRISSACSLEGARPLGPPGQDLHKVLNRLALSLLARV